MPVEKQAACQLRERARDQAVGGIVRRRADSNWPMARHKLGHLANWCEVGSDQPGTRPIRLTLVKRGSGAVVTARLVIPRAASPATIGPSG